MDNREAILLLQMSLLKTSQKHASAKRFLSRQDMKSLLVFWVTSCVFFVCDFTSLWPPQFSTDCSSFYVNLDKKTILQTCVYNSLLNIDLEFIHITTQWTKIPILLPINLFFGFVLLSNKTCQQFDTGQFQKIINKKKVKRSIFPFSI